MADHFYSSAARSNLLALWEFIAQDNVDAADRVQQEVQQVVSRLARNPAATSGAIIWLSVSFYRHHGRTVQQTPKNLS